VNCSWKDDEVCLFAAIELGQGEFGSVLKGTWQAPSGELVQTSLSLLPSLHGGYEIVVVCLSVCLSVSNFAQKLPNRFA